MKKYVLSLVVVFYFASIGLSATVAFTNAEGDRLWTNPGNWNMGDLTNTLPNQSDNWVVMCTADGPIISDGMDAMATSIRLGFGFGVANMQVTGGTLTTNDWIMVGDDGNGKGNLEISGGVISTGTAPFWIGFVGEGHLTMSGGTIYAGGFDINLNNTAGGALSTAQLSGTAKIIVNGDITSKLQGYASSGMLTGATWNYDGTNQGKTTITAIPEPATLLLLAIGGVVLRRRK